MAMIDGDYSRKMNKQHLKDMTQQPNSGGKELGKFIPAQITEVKKNQPPRLEPCYRCGCAPCTCGDEDRPEPPQGELEGQVDEIVTTILPNGDKLAYLHQPQVDALLALFAQREQEAYKAGMNHPGPYYSRRKQIEAEAYQRGREAERNDCLKVARYWLEEDGRPKHLLQDLDEPDKSTLDHIAELAHPNTTGEEA